MRIPPFCLAGLLVPVLLLIPAVASAQGIDIHSGQKVDGGIDDASDFQVFRFHALEGDLLSIKLKVPGRSDLEPLVQLIGPRDEFEIPAVVSGKFRLKKLLLPDSGLHIFVVYGAGTTGAYKMAFKQKHAKIEPVTKILNPASTYSLALPAGAKVTFDLKAAKGIDVFPGIDELIDPTDTDILDPDRRKERKKKARLVVPECAHFGYHTIEVRARAGEGAAILKTKIKAPRPPVKKLTRDNGFESVVFLIRAPDGVGGFDHGVLAEVRGESVTGATLHFPAGSGIEPVALPEDSGDFSHIQTGVYPDGVYELVIVRTGDAVERRKFHIHDSWPAELALTVTDGDTATPTLSWTGGWGAMVIYVGTEEYDSEEGEWIEEYGTLMSGSATSHTAPTGPLDAVPHGFQVMAIGQGLKATMQEVRPE
ncbi:MAG: hypothetical protein ABFS86_08360 [Planctomycetota bacterium]